MCPCILVVRVSACVGYNQLVYHGGHVLIPIFFCSLPYFFYVVAFLYYMQENYGLYYR